MGDKMTEEEKVLESLVAEAISECLDDYAKLQKENKELKRMIEGYEEEIMLHRNLIKELEDDLEYYENKEYHKQCAEEYMNDIRRGMNET